jgi:hypothetical protein
MTKNYTMNTGIVAVLLALTILFPFKLVAKRGQQVNMDVIRFIVKLQGNKVTLRTAPFPRGGLQIANEELVWERIN